MCHLLSYLCTNLIVLFLFYNDFSSELLKMLPEVIDKLTPANLKLESDNAI